MKRLIVGLLVVVAFVFSLSASNVMAQDVCEGNFDCDQDVDGTDLAVLKEDFGRNAFNNPCDNCYTCPPCMVCEPCNTCSCWTPPAPVPKTGQTISWATGDDGDLQKGVEAQNPRFTDHGNGTVRDNLTGLIWLKDGRCFGFVRSWNDALSDCNGLADGQCELTDGSSAGDWRLPNRSELFSLLDVENQLPPLPSGHPFTGVQGVNYWSSTTLFSNSDYAWYVHMVRGIVKYDPKDGIGGVLPVRDPL